MTYVALSRATLNTSLYIIGDFTFERYKKAFTVDLYQQKFEISQKELASNLEIWSIISLFNLSDIKIYNYDWK